MPNVSVHPNLAAVYRQKVEELETLLEDAEHKDEAMELIRSLIEKIELTPKEGGGLEAILHGDLARILALVLDGQQVAEEAKPLRGAGGRRFQIRRSPCRVLPSRASIVGGCGDRI